MILGNVIPLEVNEIPISVRRNYGRINVKDIMGRMHNYDFINNNFNEFDNDIRSTKTLNRYLAIYRYGNFTDYFILNYDDVTVKRYRGARGPYTFRRSILNSI